MGEKLQRRRFNRMQVTLPSVLTSRHSGTLDGEIRDFSAEGLLFVFTQVPGGDPLPNQFVTISFVTDNKTVWHISGRISRVFDRMLGIHVTDFPEAAFHALVMQTEMEEIENDAVESQYTEDQSRVALSDCAGRFHDVMLKVTDRFYVLYNTRMERDAEGAKAALQEQMLMRQVWPVLTQLRSRIEAIWLDGYEANVIQARLDDRRNRKPKELALVEADSFDDWLAVTQAINRLQQHHIAALTRLELRYFMLMRNAKQAAVNPYAPQSILWMLHDAIDSRLPIQQIKVLVYDLFANALDERLDELYQSLYQILGFVDPVRRAQVAGVVASAVQARAMLAAERTAHRLSSVAPVGDRSITESKPESATFVSAHKLAKVASPPFEEEMDVAAWLHAIDAPSHVQAGLAVQDFGLTQFLWQYNWLSKNANEQSVSQQIDALASLPLKSGIAESRDVLVDVLLLQDEPVPGFGITAPVCRREAFNRLHESAADRMANVLPEKVNTAVRETLLERIGSELDDSLCHSGILGRFLLLGQLFDRLMTSQQAGSHLASFLVRLKPWVEYDCFRDPAGLFTRQSPLLRFFQLLERMMLVADDEGHVLDQRLLHLLGSLVDVVIDGYLNKFPDGCNVLLEHLLGAVAGWRKIRAASLQQLANSLPATELEDLAGFPAAVLKDVALLVPGDWVSLPVPGGRSYWQVLLVGDNGRLWLMTNASTTHVLVFSHVRFCSQWELGQLQAEPRFREPLLQRWLESAISIG